jgi:hypothetical protein
LYICIEIFIHICIHICIHIYREIWADELDHHLSNVCPKRRVGKGYVYIPVYMNTYVCIYEHLYVYICIYVHLYVYIYEIWADELDHHLSNVCPKRRVGKGYIISCIYEHLCVYMCIYVHLYVYI